MKLRLLTVLLLAALVVPAAMAQDSTFVSRSWKNENAPMTASLSVQVPVTQVGPNGQTQVVYESRWVQVAVRVGSPAPLRLGEVEFFRVSVYTNGGYSPTINVHVDPDLVYHSYRGEFASTSGFGGPAHLYLYHNGRIKNVPPATFTKVSAEFTTPDAPFTLGFEDFAVAENADAATRYAFTIKRAVFLGSDKLVASGEIAAPAEGRPAVVITPGCPFTQGAAEYFKDGKKYRVGLSLLRAGSAFYVDRFSPAATFEFTWKKGGVHELRRVDAHDVRSRIRRQKFEDLHRD